MQMMRIILTAIIIITMLAKSVIASQTYFCQGTSLVNWEGHRYESYNTQNFKFYEDSKKVVFGSGGFFNQSEAVIVDYYKPGIFKAETITTKILLWNHVDFYSASITDRGVTVITALCGKF